MKLKTTLLLAYSIALAHGATSTTFTNANGRVDGVPIVDNTGTPISIGDSTFQIGTFSSDFITGLGSLNTSSDDQLVIDAFQQSGSNGAFNRNGLFNTSIGDADGDGSLGNASAPLYILITYAPVGSDVQALVLNGNAVFPVQEGGLGQIPTVNITPDNALSLVAFGNGISLIEGVDTSSYPSALQNEGFSRGLTFDVIPEPSTSLLAGLAGLALAARRRR